MYEIDTVMTWVAGLHITGKLQDGTDSDLHIMDIPDLIVGVEGAPFPLLQLDVTQQIVSEPYSRDTFGGGNAALGSWVHTIPLVLMYSPLGSDLGLQNNVPYAIQTVKALAQALTENDKPPNPVQDMQISSVTLGGTVFAPNGDECHGAIIMLKVREYFNDPEDPEED